MKLAPPLDVRMGRTTLPATCGELVQGILDGRSCLVSCPIDRYGSVAVQLSDESQSRMDGGSGGVPSRAFKAAAALRAGLAYWRESVPAVRVRLNNFLPLGRGYGSSTIDVGGILHALSRALSRRLTELETAQLAVAIEPTDSTLFSGLTLFDHRLGRFHEHLGPAPSLAVIVLDSGGEVDTLAYNREVTPESLRRFSVEHREAFDLLKTGLAERDWKSVGEAATLSARTHQQVLFNPFFETALTACQKIDGLGVCRAHSGTLLGILIDPARTLPDEAQRRIENIFLDRVEVRSQKMTDGGPQSD